MALPRYPFLSGATAEICLIVGMILARRPAAARRIAFGSSRFRLEFGFVRFAFLFMVEVMRAADALFAQQGNHHDQRRRL